MELKQSIVEELLLDPVLAAYAIMGAELDVFQQARLRFYWFVPEVVDSSGTSSGKTIIQFIYVNLRCILMPDHVAGVYFPGFQVAKEEFWPYFYRFIEQSAVFRAQFVFHHNKVGEHLFPGAWVMDYKNKSKLVMPAPSFEKDADTQASRRFNTLMVDEWLKAETMGEGLGRQLVERVTRASFNKRHPVWCNHLKFLGHAESPSHKGYRRVRAYRRAILDGSQRYGLISFNFEDWTAKFAEKFREDNIIESQRKNLTPDQFDRQMRGIWTRDGANYYSEAALARQCQHYVLPFFGRLYENEVNSLGFDIAQSTSARADFTSAVVHRIVEVNRELQLECKLKNIPLPPITHTFEGRAFNRTFPFAHRLKNADVNAIAGFLHFLHLIFGFGKIVLDPRGGGLFVYEQLMKAEQIINGVPTQVLPLCTRFEPLHMDKQPIVCLFQRGGELDQLVIPQSLKAEEGFVEAMHVRYRQAWEAGTHHWPISIEDRSPIEVRQWTKEQVWANRLLDEALRELSNVRQLVDKDGQTPLVSRQGFHMFAAKGKKDLAYASLMAHAGGDLWLSQYGMLQEDEEEAVIV